MSEKHKPEEVSIYNLTNIQDCLLDEDEFKGSDIIKKKIRSDRDTLFLKVLKSVLPGDQSETLEKIRIKLRTVLKSKSN